MDRRGLLLSLATSACASAAVAGEPALSGAWLFGGERCADVFVRMGKTASFKKPVDVFASAFIISGDRIRTPMASCRIKASKRSGERRLLTLMCATSVSVDEVQASLEPMPDGSLRRYFNAKDEVGSKYERCF